MTEQGRFERQVAANLPWNFGVNLVDAIFGGGAREQTSVISRVVYALVGLAGLGTLVLLPRLRDRGDRAHRAAA